MIALINIADARFHYSLWVLLIVLLMICSVDQKKKNDQPPPSVSLMSAIVLQLCDNFILFALYVLL